MEIICSSFCNLPEQLKKNFGTHKKFLTFFSFGQIILLNELLGNPTDRHT